MAGEDGARKLKWNTRDRNCVKEFKRKVVQKTRKNKTEKLT